jgi:anti-sigma B factor antagonist
VAEPAPFAVSAADRAGARVITVSGEVDAHTAEHVRTPIEAAVGPGARVVVDLSDVTFMDSTGLGIFVIAFKHLREQEGSLDLVITSPRVLKVFSLTGLDVVIPIHDALETALAP